MISPNSLHILHILMLHVVSMSDFHFTKLFYIFYIADKYNGKSDNKSPTLLNASCPTEIHETKAFTETR